MQKGKFVSVSLSFGREFTGKQFMNISQPHRFFSLRYWKRYKIYFFLSHQLHIKRNLISSSRCKLFLLRFDTRTKIVNLPTLLQNQLEDAQISAINESQIGEVCFTMSLLHCQQHRAENRLHSNQGAENYSDFLHEDASLWLISFGVFQTIHTLGRSFFDYTCRCKPEIQFQLRFCVSFPSNFHGKSIKLHRDRLRFMRRIYSACCKCN